MHTTRQYRIGNHVQHYPSRACQTLDSYMLWRWVKFPMLGDIFPDKLWLGAALKHYRIQRFFFQTKISRKSQVGRYEISWLSYSYRLVTRLSLEQVTIAQLHGSTAFSSQFRTPWGSINELLISIKACTVKLHKFKSKIIRILKVTYNLKKKNCVYLQSWYHLEKAKPLQKPRSTRKKHNRKQLNLLSFWLRENLKN